MKNSRQSRKHSLAFRPVFVDSAVRMRMTHELTESI